MQPHGGQYEGKSPEVFAFGMLVILTFFCDISNHLQQIKLTDYLLLIMAILSKEITL